MRAIFLQTLSLNGANSAVVTKIDQDLDITGSSDPEVQFRWYSVALAAYYSPVYVPAYLFVTEFGRGKYVLPIYQSLELSGQHDKAIEWNNANWYLYSEIVEAAILAILNAPAPTPN